MARNGRKKYFSYEEKIRAVRLLEVNNNDRVETLRLLEEQYGKDKAPSRATLNNWISQYQKQISSVDLINSQNAEILESFADKQKEFIKYSHDVKWNVVQRIAELIPDERNLSKLSECLRVLNNITEGMPGEDPDNKDRRSIFHMINQQLIVNQDGKKEN